MKTHYNRRQFIRTASVAGMGLSLSGAVSPLFAKIKQSAGLKAGIIGLDTSHSVEFTKALNTDTTGAFAGYKVVAAYPRGSQDIESAVSRIPAYTEEVKKLGVEIVGSIQQLLDKVDVVFLETNDGRVHLEQALQVLKARKTVFIDKPLATSLHDAVAICNAAKRYGTPIFSASTLRYIDSIQAVVDGKSGKVLGADTYSPATAEKTHPDFFWYGIHGVEMLFAVMGPGCKSVVRVSSGATDVVVGTWNDGRIGTFRGNRSGVYAFGGTVYGSTGNATLGTFVGYQALLVQIINFFKTGIAPVAPAETLEIIAFMEAANESKRRGGVSITLAEIMEKAGQPK